MKFCTSPKFEEKNNEPVAVALGTFDCLHLGHQAVINRAKLLATKNNINSGIFTFDPHPRKIISPAKTPGLLLSKRQKKYLLEKMGVDYYFQQKFTPAFSRLSFENFVSDILISKLNVKHAVAGYNYHFGRGGEGNPKKLKNLGLEHGFAVTIVEKVKNNNNTISSTLIRNLIKKGEVNKVKSLLGRHYKIAGKVVHGDKRGSELGIPTANIAPETNYVLPPAGVYAAYCYLGGNKLRAIANLGYKPTFSTGDYTIEIHIFDFSQEIYSQRLEFAPVEFIRKEKNFAGSKELIEQINKDILYTKKVLC